MSLATRLPATHKIWWSEKITQYLVKILLISTGRVPAFSHDQNDFITFRSFVTVTDKIEWEKESVNMFKKQYVVARDISLWFKSFQNALSIISLLCWAKYKYFGIFCAQN